MGTSLTLSLPNSARALLVQWANEQDGWVRLIVSEVLASSAELPEGLLMEIYEQFLVEKGLGEGDIPTITALSDDGVAGEVTESFYLRKLYDLKNVNALCGGQELEFNSRLTIVFGQNASGKTGYVRVLKLAAAVRSAEKVLPDVVGVSGNKGNPSARIKFSMGDIETEVHWQNQMSLSPFTRINVFDSRATNLHVDQDLNYIYTPAELARFPRVQKAIESVRGTFDLAIKEAGKESNLFLPYFTRGTKVYTAIETLGAATNLPSLKAAAVLSEAELQQVAALKIEIDALKSSNPELQIKAGSDLKVQVESLGKGVAAFVELDEAKYSELREKVKTAKDKFDATNRTSFAGLAIPGILQEEWRRFIVAGEEYLRTLEVKAEYPGENSPCLYCQQPLADPAVELLKKYRDFCNSSFRSELDAAQKSLDAFVAPLKLDFTKFGEQLLAVLESVKHLTVEQQSLLKTTLENCKEASQAMLEVRDIVWPSRNKDASEARTLLKGLWEQCQAMLKDLAEKKEERERILKEKEGIFAELEARTKLGQLIELIEDFVERAKWIDRAKIQQRKFQGILRSLTDQSKLASTELLNRDFKTRFEEECVALRVPPMKLEFPGRDAQSVRKKVVASDHKPSTCFGSAGK